MGRVFAPFSRDSASSLLSVWNNHAVLQQQDYGPAGNFAGKMAKALVWQQHAYCLAAIATPFGPENPTKDNFLVWCISCFAASKLKNNNVQPLFQSWLTENGVETVLGQQNAQTGYEDCRSSVRQDVDAEILLHQSGGKTHRAQLVNISATGFKMTSLSGLDPSKPVFIRLPGLPILAATVRWEGFSDFGCEFARPLEAHVMEYLLKKLQNLR